MFKIIDNDREYSIIATLIMTKSIRALARKPKDIIVSPAGQKKKKKKKQQSIPAFSALTPKKRNKPMRSDRSLYTIKFLRQVTPNSVKTKPSKPSRSQK